MELESTGMVRFPLRGHGIVHSDLPHQDSMKAPQMGMIRYSSLDSWRVVGLHWWDLLCSHVSEFTLKYGCSFLWHANPRLADTRQVAFFYKCIGPSIQLQYATDFYKAITTITSGLMLPLTTADLLSHAIVASVLENLDMERLVQEVGQAVAQRILGNNESVDDVARELHERLLLRNESTKKVVIESIYKDSEESRHNVQIFTDAPSLAEARPLLKKVRTYHFFSGAFPDTSSYRFTEIASRKNIWRRNPRLVAPLMAIHLIHLRPLLDLHHRKFLHHRPHQKAPPLAPRHAKS